MWVLWLSDRPRSCIFCTYNCEAMSCFCQKVVDTQNGRGIVVCDIAATLSFHCPTVATKRFRKFWKNVSRHCPRHREWQRID